MSELCAITTISNPANYRSRFRLYHEFRKRIEDSGVPLCTIELATGDQEFAVTEAGNPHNFQVRSSDEIWYKENLLNVALRRLPKQWNYVALLDADILFVRPDWADQTLSLLKRHAFVQMFTHVVDLGPNYEPLKTYEGFAYRQLHTTPNKEIGQTGYAWAVRRDVLDAIGGLMDWSIMGSNDYFMALALTGAVTPDTSRMPGSRYAQSLLNWQQKCEGHRNIGYLENTILHFWHGRRNDRGYDNRWRILADNQFDPVTDLVRDSQGLLRLAGNKPAFHEALRGYFRARNEDASEL
jgi:hypothetical protein